MAFGSIVVIVAPVVACLIPLLARRVVFAAAPAARRNLWKSTMTRDNHHDGRAIGQRLRGLSLFRYLSPSLCLSLSRVHLLARRPTGVSD
jgi:hypothetical protein